MGFTKQSVAVILLVTCSIASILPPFQKFPDLSLLQVRSTAYRPEFDKRQIRDDTSLFRSGQRFRPKNSGESAATGKCAINLFGLPRAFQSLVLPSLVQSVIRPNALYNCDYFVHYYYLTYEKEGRANSGGRLDPDEILLLKQAVHDVSPNSIVEFRYDQEQAFWDQYQPLIDRIRTVNDTDGHYLYFPWRDKSYLYTLTTDNIVKMWHSIQSAWELMTEHETMKSQRYDRVAMLRSDVVYMTPIDLFQANRQPLRDGAKVAVVPAFGRYPVSDRMIIGPRDAVEIWAAQRFDRLETHVQFVHDKHPGWGMHSERFVKWTIFPAIRETNTTIVEDDFMCFFRARADETVMIKDCEGNRYQNAAPSIVKNLGSDKIGVLESILGRKCLDRTVALSSSLLQCPAQEAG
jgi:hypothetical protein